MTVGEDVDAGAIRQDDESPAVVDASVIAVVGMHRSGTSLITRMLNLVGVGLGDHGRLMPAHARDNPTGYWEHHEIVRLNDEILERLDGSWDRPPILIDGWEDDPLLDPFRSRARTIADELIDGGGNVVGWKDPRSSLLLPFWKTVLPVRATVLAIRHPFQVAASLAQRDGLLPEHAAWLWCRYVVAAWRNHPDRAVVDYDMTVSDPREAATNLAGFVGFTAVADDVLARVEEFVDPDLSRAPYIEFDLGPQMALALSLYALVQSQPFGLVDGVVDAVHDHWVDSLS